MPYNNEQVSVPRTKQFSILALLVMALFIFLSVLNDNIFLDRLLPATVIVSLVLLIRNLGERP